MKSKVVANWPRIGCDSRLMAKVLKTAVQVNLILNLGGGSTN